MKVTSRASALVLFIFAAGLSGSAAGTGALFFDGVNDYVTFGAATNISNLGVTNFTIECWFKRQGAGKRGDTGSGGFFALPLVTKGMAENEAGRTNMNYFFGIGTNGLGQTVLAADFEDYNTGLNHPVYGNNIVGSNVWVHAAVTYDIATTNWALYVNGQPDTTTNVFGVNGSPITNALMLFPRYDSLQHAALASCLRVGGATNNPSSGFFAGSMDEVRIWNYARSAADIAANYNLLITNATGLIARWNLDESSGSTVANSVSGGVNGTLTNGVAFTNGYFNPSVSITNPLNNATFSATSITLEADASDADGSVTKVEFYVGNTLLGDDTASPFNFTWSSVPPGAHAFKAVATDNLGMVTTSAVVNVSVTPPAGVGGLYFDGVNDYVTMGVASGVGVSNFTVECWFNQQGAGKRSNTGVGGINAVPLVTKGMAENENGPVDCNWFFGIGTNNSGQAVLAADFEDFNNGLNHPVRGTNLVASNTWQHAAVTYDVASSNWTLYLNGLPDVSTNILGLNGTPITNVLQLFPRYDSSQHAALGTSLLSSGNTNASSGFFAGTLDEVRIWNYARSADEITSNYQAQIISAPGLIARWGLDDGAGFSATNSGTAGIAGILTNGPVWVAGYAFPSLLSITAPPESQSVECGSNATFTVTASGAGPLSYQWYFAANALNGETNDTLLLPGVSASSSGSYFVTVQDNGGSVTSAPALLTITDTNAPVITACATNMTLAASANCQAAIPDLTTQIVASDSCSAVSITQSPVAGTLVGSGSHLVTLTVSDAATNTATCSATVTVVDVTAPLITVCATNMTLSADTNCEAAIPDLTAQVIASDSCSVVTISQSPLAGTLVGLGNHPVTLTVSDAATNTSTCSATITVADATAPIIMVCATNLTLNADTNCQAVIPDLTIQVVASDSCGAVTISQSPVAGTLVGLGDALVTLTVSDTATNTITCSATITVVDTFAPVLTTPPQSRTNLVGTSATFTVTASSCSAVSYQWRFGTNVLSGETNPTLTLTNVQLSHAGDYSVVLANSAGNATSGVAVLTVLMPAAPALTAGPMILPNGHFYAGFIGTPNVDYTIKWTAEIAGPWQTLTNLTSDANGFLGIEDLTVPAPPMRFYRAVYP